MAKNQDQPTWHEYEWFESATLADVQNCLKAGFDVNFLPSFRVCPSGECDL